MGTLTKEQVAALLEAVKPKQYIREKTTHKCRECDSRLDQGYCKNADCPVDAPKQMYACGFCGWCSTPEKCVKSVLCVNCLAQPGEGCRKLNGTPDSYHEERWLTVKKLYGTYYK